MEPDHIVPNKCFAFLMNTESSHCFEYPKFTGADMDWPPYSPDLTPCDYFLWGTLKDIVSLKHPATLDELESAICVACESISVETLRNVMANFILRLRHLSCANGEHFEHNVM
ncbi:uncharacterized protein TNCV_2857751 [Trichonephila clavipes]|nr:uncharacterized protein TNCV_2857751 [Trichonephila clavipes]